MSFFLSFALHSADDKMHVVHHRRRERRGIKRCAWVSVFNRTRSLKLLLQTSLIQHDEEPDTREVKKESEIERQTIRQPEFPCSGDPTGLLWSKIMILLCCPPARQHLTDRQRERDTDIPSSPSNTYKRWPFLFDFVKHMLMQRSDRIWTQTLESKATVLRTESSVLF